MDITFRNRTNFFKNLTHSTTLPPIRPACAGRRASRACHTHQKFGVVAGSDRSMLRRET
ncbi:MAG: hypothetical protein V1770_02445 [bacterium]